MTLQLGAKGVLKVLIHRMLLPRGGRSSLLPEMGSEVRVFLVGQGVLRLGSNVIENLSGVWLSHRW